MGFFKKLFGGSSKEEEKRAAENTVKTAEEVSKEDQRSEEDAAATEELVAKESTESTETEVVGENQEEQEQEADKGVRVFPQIMVNYDHRIYASDAGSKFIKANSTYDLPREEWPIVRNLNDDLMVGFQVERSEGMETMKQSLLDKNPQLNAAMLFQVAQNSLAEAVGDALQIHDTETGMKMVTIGANLEACLILVDEIWDDFFHTFEGDVLMAIPTKDVLLVCGVNNFPAKLKMIDLINMYFEDPNTEGLLSKGIYLREIGTDGFRLLEVAF